MITALVPSGYFGVIVGSMAGWQVGLGAACLTLLVLAAFSQHHIRVSVQPFDGSIDPAMSHALDRAHTWSLLVATVGGGLFIGAVVAYALWLDEGRPRAWVWGSPHV